MTAGDVFSCRMMLQGSQGGRAAELRKGDGMGPTLEERAAEVVRCLGMATGHLHTDAERDLERALVLAIREAVEGERAGLRTTLRLCVEAFNGTLALETVPRPFRAAVRVCRGLCLEALGDEGGSTDRGGFPSTWPAS